MRTCEMDRPILMNVLKLSVMQKTVARVVTLCVLLAVLATGCTTTSYPLPPAKTQNTDYLIGPGDSLEIFVWRNPEVSRTVPVRPDGKISTPLVEDLVAAGKTPTQLARDIERELAKYLKEPLVTIIVANFVGPFSQQIRVVGEAAKPQVLAYRENLSALDVMIAVGGLTEFAAGNDARLIRTVNGEQQQFGVRLDDLVRYGDISANVQMLPGDILIIPESWF